MIKIENIQISGFEAAFRGLRNPMNSWNKSDSRFGISSYPYNDDDYDVTATYINPDFIEHSQEWEEEFEAINNWLLENGILKRNIETGAIEYAFIGKNDIDLARRMILAGTDEAKFMRMIHIQMDVTAPMYWWKEADTYKVGTVANSCSTMHKIHAKEFVLEDFSCDHLEDESNGWIKDEKNQLWCSAYTHMETTVNLLNAYRYQYLETKDKKYWWQMIQLLPSSYNQKRTLDFNYQTARAMYFARKNHKLDEWHTFTDTLLTLPYGHELIGVK